MDFDSILKKSKEAIEENLGDYIVSVGSLTENKNHALLIKSFSKLKKEKKIFEKLVIIGEGKERENLEHLIKELGMKKDILLLGQKTNPYKYIANSKLFVLPSKNEGLPLTLLETLSLNKMIIAVNNNGSSEILKHNYGVLVKNDEEELANKIYFYLKNNQEKIKYELLSKERIKDFKINKIKTEVEELINKI